MTNNINTFWDTHVHIFSHRWINDDVYFGRHHLPAWAWPVIKALRAAAHGAAHWIPDDVTSIIETALDVFRLDDDARRVLDMIELFYLPASTQLDRLRAHWRAAGIAGGYILIPAVGDYRRATREICAAVGDASDVRVFAPWQVSNDPGVFGVKFYPALEGRAVVPQVVGCGRPIIAHCSHGGIRRGQRSEAVERRDNAPDWVLDALEYNPRARIVLAHGGGEWAFLRACDPAKDVPIKNLIRDHGGPGTEHPGAWIGADVAFHEGIGRSRYTERWLGTDALMVGHVLTGSDWPLHLPKYTYATWASRARYTFGAGLDDIEAARGTFEGRE